MTKLNIGDRVTVSAALREWPHGLKGTIVKGERWIGEEFSCVEFSEKDAKGRGHAAGRGDDAKTRWYILNDYLNSAEDEIVIGTPTLAGDVGLPPQTRKVLAHLLAGKEITRLKADKVYGIVNLPDCIYRLREEGYDVVTTRAKDEEGRRYVVYSLPPSWLAAVAA